MAGITGYRVIARQGKICRNPDLVRHYINRMNETGGKDIGMAGGAGPGGIAAHQGKRRCGIALMAENALRFGKVVRILFQTADNNGQEQNYYQGKRRNLIIPYVCCQTKHAF